MTVDWHVFALVSAGLFTLLALTGLRRGKRGIIRMCYAIGIAVAVMGLATGRLFAIVGGVVIIAVVRMAGGV
jgi:hypothetical protein